MSIYTLIRLSQAQMNIGITVSPSYPVPPHEGYGGTQRGAFELATGLADRGHRVFLATTGDSTIDHPDVEVIPTLPSSIYIDGPVEDANAEFLRRASEHNAVTAFESLQSKGELDVVNLRWERAHTLKRLGELGVPHILSISCSLGKTVLDELIEASSEDTYAMTAHTESHRMALGDERIIVAPYGIDVHKIPFSDRPLSGSDAAPTLPLLQRLLQERRDYVLHLATIMPHKGQATSIAAAKQAGIPIIIAGTPSAMNPALGQNYFDAQIAPHIDDQNVFYFGNANEIQKYELMRGAVATLFSSGFEDPGFSEPFGRVLAESLASGTPVVGYDNGAFNELVPQGIAGLSFESIAEAAERIRQVSNLSRLACRQHAENALSSETFVNNMESLLQEATQEADVA